MGADGGSIPDRSDLVRTKAKTKITDKDLLREMYFLCALSKRPLTKPVVLDPLGKLYNKDAIIEFFLDRSKYGDGDRICGYLKSVKDLLTLNLFPNPEYTAPSASTTSHIPARSPFVCPLSFKEMSGTVPFIALRPCGCVFSDSSIRGIIPNLTKGKGIKAVPKEERDDKPDEAKPVVASSDNKTVACPNCGTSFDPSLSTSILPINPSRDIQDILLEDLLTARAAAKSSKKRKAAAVVSHADEAEGETITSTNGTVKAAKRDENGERKASFKSASPAPGTGSGRATPTANTLNRSVHQKLADQEVKRLKAQEGMSDAVKAMFKSKEPDQRGTGGAADFFGRTFTRYAA